MTINVDSKIIRQPVLVTGILSYRCSELPIHSCQRICGAHLYERDQVYRRNSLGSHLCGRQRWSHRCLLKRLINYEWVTRRGFSMVASPVVVSHSTINPWFFLIDLDPRKRAVSSREKQNSVAHGSGVV